MSNLILPTKPLNLMLPHDAQAHFVDGDMHEICERVREISPALRIVLLTHNRTETHSYAIMEECDDGECRLVFKVRELDGRVIQRLQKIMAIPLAQRIAKCEAENYRFEQEEHEKSMDDLYERVGRPMLRDLERCGFIQRPTSYAKRGHVGAKGSRGKS